MEECSNVRMGAIPKGLTSSQPNIEYFTTELYGGPKQYDQFPIDKGKTRIQHDHRAILSSIEGELSRWNRRILLDNPIVDHNLPLRPLGHAGTV